MIERNAVIDLSRLIWRLWRGGLPTGVDRVCLAYVEHFRSRSCAMVQWRGHRFVLAERDSDRLFELVERGRAGFRRGFVRLASTAFRSVRRLPAQKGLLYLNIGHTGLDNPSLGSWIEESGVRAVFLIHDLIPLLHPEYCRAGEQEKHRRRLENALRNAAGVIGNSQATIRDLELFASRQGLPMPPAIAAPIAGPPVALEVTPKQFARPHFVVLGTIEGRKNHLLLLHVWKRLVAGTGENSPLLVIVGQRGWEAGSVFAMLDRANDLKGHVLELGQSADDELAALIAGARALLMPSFAEGFGLPIVEALELGTPVIASDLAVFREFAGNIPTYLDPLDGPAWQREVIAFLDDCPERARQLDSIAGYQAPAWSGHFRAIDEWIETLT